MTQFVECVFKEGDARGYTYQNDGEPVKAGDRVLVPRIRRGSDQVIGQKTVTVRRISEVAPPYAIHSLIGLAPAEEKA